MRGINKYFLIIDSNPLQCNGINLPLVSFSDTPFYITCWQGDGIIIQETVFRDFNKILISKLFASYFLNEYSNNLCAVKKIAKMVVLKMSSQWVKTYFEGTHVHKKFQ